MNKFNTKTIKELKNKILYICAIKHDFEGGHIKSVERFVEATDKLEAFIIKALKAQEQEHQKVTDFLIKSHAFDMKELKEEHQKKLKEINEFGGDETDAYNLIDKLNEEK